MNTPLVTVLMATYNREKLVAQSIESVLAQTYPNIELLICDDCSTDDTVALLKKYAADHTNIKVFVNEVNKKFIYTINWLFQQAKGEYICICDSDDWIAPSRVAHQLSVLNNFKADAVISEFIRVQDDGVFVPHVPRYPAVTQIKPNSDDVFSPSGSLMMHRSIIEKLKGYPEYFADSFCADIYFINTIADQYKLLYDPTHVYYYRLTPGSMTQAFDLYKLTKLQLAHFLIEQRKETGTDYLEQQNWDALENKRKEIEQNPKWASEQYRKYATRSIDENQLSQAAVYLRTAFKNNFFSVKNFKTTFYFLRRKINGGQRKA